MIQYYYADLREDGIVVKIHTTDEYYETKNIEDCLCTYVEIQKTPAIEDNSFFFAAGNIHFGMYEESSLNEYGKYKTEKNTDDFIAITMDDGAESGTITVYLEDNEVCGCALSVYPNTDYLERISKSGNTFRMDNMG